MSLIPDKPLIFFPHVASTLGLEEAILLQALKEVSNHRQAAELNGVLWTELPLPALIEMLPFWNIADIRRLAGRLSDQGVLLIDILAESPTPQNSQHLAGQNLFRFAFNDGCTAKNISQRAYSASEGESQINAPGSSINRLSDPTNKAPALSPAPQQIERAMKTITRGWQPEPDVLQQLSQYGIPSSFAQDQIPEFVTYWSERAEPRHSWGSKFIKQVVKLWREQESREARRQQEVPIDQQWQPSPEALEILLRADISRNFIDDAIPEFILFWRDKGTRSSTWNTQFVQHIRRQWAKYQSSLTSGGQHEFRPMSTDWRPDASVFDILNLAGIERSFAEQQTPEFILYWRESGQSLNSWNTKFLQYVKRQWAYHNNTSVTQHATQQTSGRTGSTRHRNLVEELSDRSWAS